MATVPSTQKILTSNEAVNTTYGGSQALKELNTWYTMVDISNTVKPYKVFTALLTQSGANDTFGLNSGDLTIGVTYSIENVGRENFDFTNVGSPNNNPGTYFVATGTTPNSWGTGGNPDDLLAYNTGAPVVTVLENTIGNVWFTYVGVGSYQIPFEACAAIGLTTSNSACFINNNSISNGITAVIFDDGDGPLVQIYTLLAGESPSDSILVNAPIEIRVYN